MSLIKDSSVLFSNVLNQDDFSQKYQIVVKLTEEQAADAEDAGLNVKTKEYDGNTQYQLTFKSKFRPRVVGHVASKDLDLQGSEIGRGSTVNVQYRFRNWKSPGGKEGVSADLIAVQVLDLKSPNSVEFDNIEEFGDEPSDI